MKVYIAAPLFTDEEKQIIRQVAHLIKEAGHEVYLPMENGVHNPWSHSNQDWGKLLFDKDVAGIDSCDSVVAIYYGMDSDTGTSWELGYAFAKSKRVVVFHNYNIDTDIGSLMICNGAHMNVRYMSDIPKALTEDIIQSLPYQS